MVHITIVSPIKAIVRANQADLDSIRKALTYENTAAMFVYRKHIKNNWWKQSNYETWKVRHDELKEDIKHTLVWFTSGDYWIRPGSIPYLPSDLAVEVINKIEYPNPKQIPWLKVPKFEPYYYQKLAVEKLIAEKHGSVEFCTGAGKSNILLLLTKALGLKTVIMTPSASIFNEMLVLFTAHFGSKYVGGVGDGKKQFGKFITVCISKSLTSLKPGTKNYADIADAQVLLSDEVHTNPAKTLEDVCHGVLGSIPYRFGFSGTLTRGDGSEILLQSIVGKTVHSLSTKEAIAGGYICDHEFKIVPIQSSNPSFVSSDAMRMKREHFLYNTNIAKFSAKLANAMFLSKNERTVILVEETSQIAEIVKYLEVPYVCAYSSDTEGLLKQAGVKKEDPDEAVKKFNMGQVPVIIGSACIGTGTNLFPVHHMVNFQGGSSEVKTKQGAVGRSVRKMSSNPYPIDCPPKTKAIIWDFNVIGIDILQRHLKQRISFYKDSGTVITYL